MKYTEQKTPWINELTDRWPQEQQSDLPYEFRARIISRENGVVQIGRTMHYIGSGSPSENLSRDNFLIDNYFEVEENTVRMAKRILEEY